MHLGSILTLETVWPHRFDPSIYFICIDEADRNHPSSFGWSIRNFLALLAIDKSAYVGYDGFGASSSRNSDSKVAKIIALKGKLAQKVLATLGNGDTQKNSEEDFTDVHMLVPALL